MNKIYTFTTRDANWLTGIAMAEDGTCLSQNSWLIIPGVEINPGLDEPNAREFYAKHYPGGYELEDVTDPANHAGLEAAYVLYNAANPS